MMEDLKPTGKFWQCKELVFIIFTVSMTDLVVQTILFYFCILLFLSLSRVRTYCGDQCGWVLNSRPSDQDLN